MASQFLKGFQRASSSTSMCRSSVEVSRRYLSNSAARCLSNATENGLVLDGVRTQVNKSSIVVSSSGGIFSAMNRNGVGSLGTITNYGVAIRNFAAAAQRPSASNEDEPRGIVLTKTKKPSDVEISRRAAPAPPPEVTPFQEVGGANQGASTLISLLVSRDTSSNPFRLLFGLLFGFGTATLAHWMMGVFDVLCIMSTTLGSLGYFLIVGGNFHALFYFITAPFFLNLALPEIEKRMGWTVATAGVQFAGRPRNNYD